MTGQTIAYRHLRQMVEPRAQQYIDMTAASASHYALDPFAHLDEGHVNVLDKDTMRERQFVPYDYQREVIEEWFDLPYLRATGQLQCRNLLVEKSRQLGITWIVAYACLWVLTYHELPGLAISESGGDIDDGGRASTVDSFFGRIRYMAQSTTWPDHLRPPLDFRGGSPALIRNRFRQRAFLVGEGAKESPGRGSTYGFVVVDEAARIYRGEAVQTAIMPACPTGRLYVSTPYGQNNLFYRLRAQRPEDTRFLRLHWTRHPVYGREQHVAGSRDDCLECLASRRAIRKGGHRFPGRATSPWYERAIQSLTDEQVAQELDIDYTGSLPARVYAEFSQDIHVAENMPGLPAGEPYDYAINDYQLAFDYGIGTTSVIVCQETAGELRVIGEFEMGDIIPEQVAAGVREVLADLGVPIVLLEAHWSRTMLSVGDPAGEARQAGTGRSLVADYRRVGLNIASRRYSIASTINATKRLLLGIPKALIVNRATCPRFISHMENNRWPTDTHGNRKPDAREPLNDQHNHMMRAFAYLVSYKWPVPEVEQSLRQAYPDPDSFSLDEGQRRRRAIQESGRTDPTIQRGMKL